MKLCTHCMILEIFDSNACCCKAVLHNHWDQQEQMNGASQYSLFLKRKDTKWNSKRKWLSPALDDWCGTIVEI